LSLLATGGYLEEDRSQATRELDFYDLKGAVEAVADAMRLRPLQFAAGSVKHLRVGQTAVIALADGTAIGNIGRLADHIATNYKFRQPIYLAELNLSAMFGSAERAVQYQTLARYPRSCAT